MEMREASTVGSSSCNHLVKLVRFVPSVLLTRPNGYGGRLTIIGAGMALFLGDFVVMILLMFSPSNLSPALWLCYLAQSCTFEPVMLHKAACVCNAICSCLRPHFCCRVSDLRTLRLTTVLSRGLDTPTEVQRNAKFGLLSKLHEIKLDEFWSHHKDTYFN